MTTALIEAGLAVTAALAAAVRGGCFLWWVWRHRGDYPNRPGRAK
jgi:hypothetical protein